MQKLILQSGHLPTLISVFLYFDPSFMAWDLLGPLSVPTASVQGSIASEGGMLVAATTLSGALLRGRFDLQTTCTCVKQGSFEFFPVVFAVSAVSTLTE
jgi:nitrate/nitrite transporter NarK